MKTQTFTYPIIASLLSLAATHAAITPYAEYPLGEAGSLGGSNKPQDGGGGNHHFNYDISGGDATTGNASFHPNATGSTAYLDTSDPGNQGWYSDDNTYSSLPTDHFAFGIFVRAAANTDETQADIFTLGNTGGSLKLSLEGNGWSASAHGVNWVAPPGGVGGSFQPDVWVHLALIRTEGITTFYIDGVANGTFNGSVTHASPHLSVSPGGGQYFNGHLDEARIVTFTPGEPVGNIITALQQGVIPTAFVNVGVGTTYKTAQLSTDESSTFRLGGAIEDSAVVTQSGGLAVVAGTAEKHLIHINQEGEIPIGSHPLIYYAGSIGGLGYEGLQLAPLPGRIIGELVNNTEDATIDLVITGSEAGDLTWTGSGSSTWNVEGNSNWVFTGQSTPEQFYAGDTVRFDDSASSTAITVDGTVTPANVFIDNTSDAYSFSGGGIGGSGTLDKIGSGSLTLTNNNTYSGPTFIDAGTVYVGDGGGTGSLGTGPLYLESSLVINRGGTLDMPNVISGAGTIEKLGPGTLRLSGNSNYTGATTLTAGTITSLHDNCLGDVAGNTTVAAGATLDVFSGGFGDEPLVINGSGVDDLGVIVNSALSGNLNGAQKVTLASDSTIGGTGRWDVRGGGSFVEGDFKLTKIGSNQISLVETAVSVKDIDVEGGLLSVEYGANVDDSNPGTITVYGGTLGFGSFGNPVTCTKPIVLNGGSINTTSTGTDGDSTIGSTVELASASNTINVQSGATITLAGAVSGSGSLLKTGPGTLALTLAPAYAGDTTVGTGTLSLAQSGLADGSVVSLGGGSTLNLAFTGTDTVDALFIDGVQQPAGIYDSSHASGRFSGSGTLTVSTGPAATAYQTWESDNGIEGAGGGADSDNDGIPNGIEFVIGGDPSGPDSDSNHLLQPVEKNDTHLVFVYRRTDKSIGDNPRVEYGSDLEGWTTARHEVDGVTIETVDDFYGDDIARVTVSLPLDLADDARLFARLAVDIP